MQWKLIVILVVGCLLLAGAESEFSFVELNEEEASLRDSIVKGCLSSIASETSLEQLEVDKLADYLLLAKNVGECVLLSEEITENIKNNIELVLQEVEYISTLDDNDLNDPDTVKAIEERLRRMLEFSKEWELPTYETHGSDYTLWNECKKISFGAAPVEEDDEDAIKLGLKTESVSNLFESRLRAARLFDSDSKPKNDWLIVSARVGVGTAFSIDVSYMREISNIGYGVNAPVILWSDSTYGTHGYDESYVMQSLSKLADDFILKYLRVNEQACESEAD